MTCILRDGARDRKRESTTFFARGKRRQSAQVMPTATAEVARDKLVQDPARRRRAASPLPDALLVLLGCAVTLAIHGYRFGEGNHTIYLLDATRRAHPELLRNDWFVTQTLQYHAAFGWTAQKLIELRAIEPVFLTGYLLLVVLMHVAWLRLACALSAGRAGYVVSLALYYASAAGTGLGMYQFMQDSSFLPSNVANVAMLWAVCFWVTGRFAASGACLGVAGLFHLNHAVVGVVMWVVLCLWEGYVARPRTLAPLGNGRGNQIAIGWVLALAPAMVNIFVAASAKLQRSGSMPLAEFVDLYVRLRHPHHYDSASWPIGLWASFLWPLPIAVWVHMRRSNGASRRAWQVLLFMLALQVVALVGAGVWFVNESLVQMSLYRFSIFAQLLACTATAAVVIELVGARQIVIGVATAACIAMAAVCVVRGAFFGAFVMPADDPEYLAVCDWARDNTPVDAVILVPPGESSMRLRGQRAIVVNFKAVPQLSGELPEWRDRLQTVLSIDHLSALPRGYRQTLRAIDERYATLAADQLRSAARAYGARYIVAPRRLDPPGDLRPVLSSPNQRYFVYDLGSREEHAK
jgi:hypothetical protein